MTIAAANILVAALGIYATIGVLTGLIYAFGGAGKIDPAAKGIPLQARLIILPGVAGLWPLMLKKLFTQKEPPVS